MLVGLPTLTDALRRQGFTDDFLVTSVLSGRASTAHFYDRMRGRLISPIHDLEGHPRGLAGRLITGDGPKYLNTPETDLYRKRTVLYGLHLAHHPITETGGAVVVEGYTDAIAAHQAGFTNVVATGGTLLNTTSSIRSSPNTTSTSPKPWSGPSAPQHRWCH